VKKYHLEPLNSTPFTTITVVKGASLPKMLH